MIDFKDCSYDLELELSEHKFVPKIDMKQYDNKSRYIKVKLYNKGHEFDVTDRNLSFRAIFRKPDNKTVFAGCKVLTGNENFVLIPVSSNTLAVPGRIIVELVIMQGVEIFSSKFFYINCFPSLHADKGQVESSDEYSGILDTIIKVEELLKDLENLNSVMTLHHVIDVKTDTKTVSFANWQGYESNNSVEVFLSGVKQIEGIDFTLDKTAKTITAFGNKTYKNGDQVLLCSLRRIHSTEYKDPEITADEVKLNGGILGANNVQDALQNLLLELNKYVPITQYEQEIADVNDLLTTSKTVVGAINELKDLIDGAVRNPGYKKLTGVVVLDAPAKSIDIPIPDFDPNADDLNVYISGAKMVEGIAYRVNKLTNQITCINGDWDIDNQIYFEVMKF